jgi:5-methylcytosine-specific restriction endonuclease McrA
VKRCTSCNGVKPPAEFYKQKDSVDGLTSRCRACRKAHVKAYRDANSCSISERRKKVYRSDPAKFIARTLAWQRREPSKMKAKADRFRQTERGRLVFVARRQLQIAKASGALTEESRKVTGAWFRTVLETQQRRCFYCHEPRTLEMEHVVPLSRGGKHVRQNIVAACSRCNRSKGRKLLIEWRRS